MIVQCENCGTKFNIEDSKIKPEGIKLRCSKCKHVFSVESPSPSPQPPPPPPAPEPAGDDFIQDFESFEKFHKELIDTPGPETGPPGDEESMLETIEFEGISPDRGGAPPSEGPSMAEAPTEEWPGPSLGREGPMESIEEEMVTPTFDMEGLEEKGYFEKPQLISKKRTISWPFVLIVVLLILAFGAYYFSSVHGMKLRLPKDIPSLIRSIPEKLRYMWEDVRGIERGSLTFSDLEGYRDIIGEVPVFVIKGKILNDTNKTKKHVRIKAILLNDKNGVLNEKQTLCGISFTKEELKTLSPHFTRGDFKIRPPVPSQMNVAPRMSIPFIVIFPNIPADAQEFQVEILEAPNA